VDPRTVGGFVVLSHDPAGRAGQAASLGSDDQIDEVLRAKYLDFCSARLTEVFLSLSEERIYRLVEEAAREANLQVGTLNFRSMVRLVTQKLEESVPLPDLETWAREYTADPERFDKHLLGLWKDLVKADTGDAAADTSDAGNTDAAGAANTGGATDEA
jgi:hypothetical protein